MENRPPSVARIAEKCGVSPMTVSRALRDDPRVAKATRENVLRMAEQLGYRPRARMGRPRDGSRISRLLVDVILGVRIAPESLFYAELRDKLAVERLFADREGEQTPRRIRLVPTLEIRESTAAPPVRGGLRE